MYNSTENIRASTCVYSSGPLNQRQLESKLYLHFFHRVEPCSGWVCGAPARTFIAAINSHTGDAPWACLPAHKSVTINILMKPLYRCRLNSNGREGYMFVSSTVIQRRQSQAEKGNFNDGEKDSVKLLEVFIALRVSSNQDVVMHTKHWIDGSLIPGGGLQLDGLEIKVFFFFFLLLLADNFQVTNTTQHRKSIVLHTVHLYLCLFGV